jgi:hypothetical protein
MRVRLTVSHHSPLPMSSPIHPLLIQTLARGVRIARFLIHLVQFISLSIVKSEMSSVLSARLICELNTHMSNCCQYCSCSSTIKSLHDLLFGNTRVAPTNDADDTFLPSRRDASINWTRYHCSITLPPRTNRLLKTWSARAPNSRSKKKRNGDGFSTNTTSGATVRGSRNEQPSSSWKCASLLRPSRRSTASGVGCCMIYVSSTRAGRFSAHQPRPRTSTFASSNMDT